MVHLVHDTDGGRQSYQSSWMSRWMRTSRDMTGRSFDYSSNATVNDLNCITEDIQVTSRSVKGLGMVKTVTSELVNGSQRLSTEGLRNERSCNYFFKDGRESDDKGASAHEIGRKFECGKAIYLKNGIQFQSVLHGVPAANDTSFRGCHFLDAVTSKNNRLDDAYLRILQHKGHDLPSQPTDLDSDEKKDCKSQSNISLNDSFRESNASLLFYTPSVRDHHFPKVQKLLGHRPSPSQYKASAKTGSKKSCFECYSLHKLPRCVHDAETMKINTTLDSVEGGFSQTSNFLLITVNSGVGLLKECDILATRREVTKINRNIPSDLHIPSPFSSRGKRGVILEPLTCSADSEGRENAGDIRTPKVTLNKVSSTEADTMDMNFSKETNPLLGGHSASSDKAFHTEANSDSSSSKTPGMEVGIPMEFSDQAKQKSNLCMDNSPKAEPGYRWIKRLKLSSSHSSARGTKSINLAENSSRKRNHCFNRTRTSDITRSESNLRMHHGEESMALDKSINLSKENLGNDLSLSHAWIQRWLRDGSKCTRKKTYTMVDCEPQSLKWALEDLQKDRSPSPSIRAMALMGRAIKTFQPCQLKKKGSLTIWNTKDV